MYVKLGNNKAIEAYREGDSEELHYRTIEGETETVVRFQDGIGLPEALALVAEVVKHHFEKDATPVWVESDSTGLTNLLCEEYRIRDNQRPATWGQAKDDEA